LIYDYRAYEVDQYGKPENMKKAFEYYQSSFYQVNAPNSHFVEDGTYLKIREMALSYTIGQGNLADFLGGTIKSVKVSLMARNFFTWSNYSGYDPEVGVSDFEFNTMIDWFDYPNFRTVTGSVEVKF
jgi:hypothetical protein